MTTKKLNTESPGKPGPDASAATGSARGLCVVPGIDSTDAVDQHGIPKWAHHPEYGYHHLGKHQMGFAMHCALVGFNLPEFDLWLSAMDECGAKKELSERRSLAMKASIEGAPEDSILRHLEWMHLRWRYIPRVEFLLPLARSEKSRRIGADVGRRRAAERKRKIAEHSKAKAVARFKTLIATGDRDAAEAMAKMATEGWRQRTLQRHLAEELKRLGRGRRSAVKARPGRKPFPR